MADERPLTRSEFVAALQEAGVATKADVERVAKRADALETSITGVGARLGNFEKSVNDRLGNLEATVATKGQLDKLGQRIDRQGRSLARRIGKLKTALAERIANVAITSTTASQFSDLERRIETLEGYHQP